MAPTTLSPRRWSKIGRHRCLPKPRHCQTWLPTSCISRITPPTRPGPPGVGCLPVPLPRRRRAAPPANVQAAVNPLLVVFALVGVMATTMALCSVLCAPAAPLVSSVALALGSANGTTVASTLGPTFALARNSSSAPRPPMPVDEACVTLLCIAVLVVGCMMAAAYRAASAPARAAARGARDAVAALAAGMQRVAARFLILAFMMVLGPANQAAALSAASASRANGLMSFVVRHNLAGPVATHRASRYVHDRYDLAVLPQYASADRYMQLAQQLGLSSETISVMNAGSGDQDPGGGSIVRPKGLHLADSGAGIHAINDKRYVVPGSLRPNTTAVSTANGVTVPPYRCDAAIAVRTQGGTVLRLDLVDAILLPDCQHTLVSLGLLARDMRISTTIAAGAEGSYFQLPCGTKVTLINAGVLIIPDAAVSSRMVRSAEAQVVRGARTPAAPPPAGSLSYETIHNRFNGRSHKYLRRMTTAHKGAPREWQRALARAPPHQCDACLRSRADKVHSKAHVPKVSEPGYVSYDIYEPGVSHVHGGHRYIIGFHDRYSKVNKLYLLMAKSDAHEAMDNYYSWARSHGVQVRRIPTTPAN